MGFIAPIFTKRSLHCRLWRTVYRISWKSDNRFSHRY